MTRWIFAVAAFACLAVAQPATAQTVVKGDCPGCPRPCCCPDDYCRKPWPRIGCLPCGEPYCYCAKPSPCIRLLSCCGPGDYCRKPCPQVCRPLRQDYYTCGEPGPCRSVVVTPATDTKTIVVEKPAGAPVGRR